MRSYIKLSNLGECLTYLISSLVKFEDESIAFKDNSTESVGVVRIVLFLKSLILFIFEFGIDKSTNGDV